MFLLTFFCAFAAGAASLTAALDRDTITLGEQATLSLTIEGGQSKNVQTPHVPGLQFSQTGTSQNVSFINGAMSSTFTVTFSVTPRQAGEFTIPALTADVNGGAIFHRTAQVNRDQGRRAVGGCRQFRNEVAFLKFTFPKSKVYAGESTVGRLELYLRDDVQNFGDFQLTGSPTDGFQFRQNRRVCKTSAGGCRSATVFTLSFRWAVPLTAIRTGELTLGPFTANVVVVLPAQDRGNPLFFF